MTKPKWDDATLLGMTHTIQQQGISQRSLAAIMGEDYNVLHTAICNAQQRAARNLGRQFIKPSPYPVYDKPLEMEGDALVIPDLEAPFHHAEFVNRVLDLADAWKISKVILAGDFVHFNSLSSWEPNWTDTPKGGLTDNQEAELSELIRSLPGKYQGKLLEKVAEIGEREAGDGVSEEMSVARKVLAGITDQFQVVHACLGNHEGRALRQMGTDMNPGDLLNLLGVESGKWDVRPYYFTLLYSGGETYRIEHPKAYSKNAAEQIAGRYLCHILQGHSHIYNKGRDRSGRYWAIHMGHCADERRFAYEAQRTRHTYAHVLGAVIVRDGYPWDLCEASPWDALRKM